MLINRNFYFLFFTLVTITASAQQFKNSKIDHVSFDKSFSSSNLIIDSINNDLYKIYNLKETNLNQFSKTLNQSDSTSIYPSPTRDFRKLGYNTTVILGSTIVAFGILWTLPESFTKWDKEEMKENGIGAKWKENVKAGPIIDQDNFFLNYIMHPYFGGVYYMTARSNGFTIFESFSYATIMSTFFWEYGVEAFAEIPSVQDLIVTPVLGSMVGEGFFIAKKKILKNDSKILNSGFLGKTTLFLIDPLNTLMDSFGYKQKIETQINVSTSGYNFQSKSTNLVLNFSMRF